MFTDMVGFTALMQENEDLARENRARHRQTLKDFTSEFNGSILQYFGDGTLIIFDSAIDAVLAALEIQKKLQKEPIIPLRIGIHTGDIVIEEDGVYGDGVNLASRMETLCTPGSIFISAKVNDEIKNHKGLKSSYLGPFELKNVKKPMDVYAVLDDEIVKPLAKELAQKRVDKMRSIAVLPFVNLSGLEENEFFSDGITEEILNALTKIKGLRVTSRTSSFAFKNTNEDIRKIGKTLGVNSVLEGSVRRSGKKVRITAQLINSEDGYHFWSETFDRELSDIFEVQDEISQIIAEKFRAEINSNESNVTSDKHDLNVEAYNSYLKGMYHFYKYTPEDTKKAVVSFKKAIELEPEHGPSYAGIASSLTYLGATGQTEPESAYSEAEQMADLAIKYNPDNYLSYFALGVINLYFKWNLPKAKSYFEKAITLNPSAPEPYSYLGWYYLIIENYPKQLEYQLKAHELNPLSIQILMNLGMAHMVMKDYEKAYKVYQKALELEPNTRGAYEGMAWIELSKENNEKAISFFEKYRSFLNDPLKGWTGIGYAYGISGKTEKAKKALENTIERQKRDKDAILEVDCAIIYAGLGELDKAAVHLENALDKRMGGLMFIKINPLWDHLRKDPRFKKIIDKINEQILF